MASSAVVVKKVMRAHNAQIRFVATADSSFSIPAGYAISAILLEETANAAVTGGVNLGITDGGSTIVSALAIAALAIKHVPEASLLLRYFSRTVAQTVYLTTVTNWNGASVNVCIVLDKVSP